MSLAIYDERRAAQPQTFIETYCTHVRGSHTGKPLRLMAWQRELVSTLFGSLTPGGRRQHNVVWLETPRKSGKTTLAAALMLYMLLVDEEAGAEIAVYSSSAQAAAICFNIVRGMVENNVNMSAICGVRSKVISYKNNHIRLISGSARSFGGMDLSMAVIDDVQNVSQHELHESLSCCMAARNNPIILYLSSAGSDKSSLGWELHRYACRVRNGEIADNRWLVRIFSADALDDWTDPKVWREAHPGLGVTISEALLRDHCVRALAAPGNVDAFRRSFLNIWTGENSGWLNMYKWDLCRRQIDWSRYKQRSCRIGLDLSATTDLTAVVAAFPEADGAYTVLPFAFCPQDTIDRRSYRHRVPYRHWADRGFLIATSGNAVDYLVVEGKILELCGQYEVIEVLYDKWCAPMLIASLLDRGVACVPVRQDSRFLNAAVRGLQQVVDEERLRHDGNPILRWCASNACVKASGTGDLRPVKRRSGERIDLAVASLFALSGYFYETAQTQTLRLGHDHS